MIAIFNVGGKVIGILDSIINQKDFLYEIIVIDEHHKHFSLMICYQLLI